MVRRQRSQLGEKDSSSKAVNRRSALNEDIALFPPNIVPEEAYVAMLYEYGRSAPWVIREVAVWRKRKPKLSRRTKTALDKRRKRTWNEYLRVKAFDDWEAGPASCLRYRHFNEVLRLFPEWPKPYLSVPMDERRRRIRQARFSRLWNYKDLRKTLLDVTESMPEITTLFLLSVEERRHLLDPEESIISRLNALEAARGSKKQYFVFSIDFQDSKQQAVQDFKAWCVGYHDSFLNTSSKTKRGRKSAPVGALKHLAAYRALERHHNAPAKAATLLAENGFPWSQNGNSNRSSSVMDAAKRGEKKLRELFQE